MRCIPSKQYDAAFAICGSVEGSLARDMQVPARPYRLARLAKARLMAVAWAGFDDREQAKFLCSASLAFMPAWCRCHVEPAFL
jgi:hypothetical protein